MTDLTSQITARLMDAARLAIEAGGNRTGKYALIAQATVDPDGMIILNWERYGPGESGQR